MDNIQKLYINYNPFIRVRSLRKCRYPLLHTLSINETHTLDAETLAELNLSEKFLWFCLDWESYEESKPNDIRWLAKMEKYI